MRIIKPSFQIMERDEQRGGLAIIELAARTCYKTEDRIAEGSAEDMVHRLIRSGHLAMIEHGDYIFQMDDYHMYTSVKEGLAMMKEKLGCVPMLNMTNLGGRMIVSGNVRAWRELIQNCNAPGGTIAWFFAPFIDRVYIDGLIDFDTVSFPDSRIMQLSYADLKGRVERLAHLRQTVRFTVDRGVTHEFVRHRLMSFAQESTRYCNYTLGKFGSEITVIEPCYLEKHTEPYDLWKRQCMSAETAYVHMLKMGLKAQQARVVLPTSTKAELIVTGTLGMWDHFFDLRARQITGPAHPQAAEVAVPLMQEMMNRFPGVIEQ